MPRDRFFRVGKKMISLGRISRQAERALELREQGCSQQEAAARLGLDRSFISRLEAAGEVRQGRRVAAIGFPIANTAELEEICRDCGLDFYLLLDNRARWEMVSNARALDFFNRVFDLVARLREYDCLIMVTSQKWLNLAEALLDIQVVHLDLGPTPISEDCRVDPLRFETILRQVLPGRPKEDAVDETRGQH